MEAPSDIISNSVIKLFFLELYVYINQQEQSLLVHELRKLKAYVLIAIS